MHVRWVVDWVVVGNGLCVVTLGEWMNTGYCQTTHSPPTVHIQGVHHFIRRRRRHLHCVWWPKDVVARLLKAKRL